MVIIQIGTLIIHNKEGVINFGNNINLFKNGYSEEGDGADEPVPTIQPNPVQPIIRSLQAPRKRWNRPALPEKHPRRKSIRKKRGRTLKI